MRLCLNRENTRFSLCQFSIDGDLVLYESLETCAAGFATLIVHKLMPSLWKTY